MAERVEPGVEAPCRGASAGAARASSCAVGALVRAHGGAGARPLARARAAFTRGPAHGHPLRDRRRRSRSLAFRLQPGLYRPSNRRLLWTRGVSGGIVVVLYFLALARIPAGEAGMLYNLFPVIATGMSIFAFGERPTVHLVARASSSRRAGVVLVLGERGAPARPSARARRSRAGGGGVRGDLAPSSIRAMRATDNAAHHLLLLLPGRAAGGAPVRARPLARARRALGASPSAMALAAFAAQVLMTEAYGALSISEAAVWLQLTPLAQFGLAVPLLGEKPALPALAGTALAVAGVAYGTARGARRAAPAASAAVQPP